MHRKAETVARGRDVDVVDNGDDSGFKKSCVPLFSMYEYKISLETQGVPIANSWGGK
jgi:hypothetical protein